MELGHRTNRNARRRARTCARLMQATHTVIAEKGVDEATIQAITDAADVGFGTFYNHFPSKDAACEAVIDATVVPWTEALDALAERTRDPAQTLACSVRLTLRRAVRESDWGWFVFRTGTWILRSRHRRDGHLARTIHRGIDAGRFHAADAEVAVTVVGGALLASLHRMLVGDLGGQSPEHVATLCLCTLGLPGAEAAEIAHRELPPLETVAGSLITELRRGAESR